MDIFNDTARISAKIEFLLHLNLIANLMVFKLIQENKCEKKKKMP